MRRSKGVRAARRAFTSRTPLNRSNRASDATKKFRAERDFFTFPSSSAG
jgi:hypothetical protein